MNKCKGCEWYGKPYWSIINPCDNCPRENTNVEILTRWQDPTIEELKTQLQQKENIIKEVRKYIKDNKLYNEEYYTHNGDKYIKSVDDFSSRQYLLYLLDKGE